MGGGRPRMGRAAPTDRLYQGLGCAHLHKRHRGLASGMEGEGVDRSLGRQPHLDGLYVALRLNASHYLTPACTTLHRAQETVRRRHATGQHRHLWLTSELLAVALGRSTEYSCLPTRRAHAEQTRESRTAHFAAAASQKAAFTAGLVALPDGAGALSRLWRCGVGVEAEAPIGRSSTAPQERGLQLAWYWQ